ncbi:unnamed protein product, partial [Adineta steineri]
QNVGVLLGSDNGTFAEQTTYSTGSTPFDVVVVDVNNDGNPDIIAPNYDSNYVSVLFNIGSVTFAPQKTYLTGTRPYGGAVADVNSDSNPDIIVTNSGDNNVGVLLNTGNGTFTAQTTYSVGTHPLNVVVLDVNNDGKPDIIVVNYWSHNVSVLLNTGNGKFSAQTTYATGTQPRDLVVADVNYDGKPDIIVTNEGSNTHEDGTVDEAVNIKHRVLKCPIFGCSRIKAFTHKKALDEHIETKQSRSFLIDLLAPSASVIGRFIGKNGVNLKQFEEANNVHLKILTKIALNSLLPNSAVGVQVRLFDAKVNADVVSTTLKLLWERAARKQQVHEDRSKQYFAQKRLPTSREIETDFDSDTRHARAFILSDDELIRQRSTRYEQTKILLQKQKARFGWVLEMHRCATTEDRQQRRRRKSVILHHQKDKKSMKHKQWVMKEELYDVLQYLSF